MHFYFYIIFLIIAVHETQGCITRGKIAGIFACGRGTFSLDKCKINHFQLEILKAEEVFHRQRRALKEWKAEGHHNQPLSLWYQISLRLSDFLISKVKLYFRNDSQWPKAKKDKKENAQIYSSWHPSSILLIKRGPKY